MVTHYAGEVINGFELVSRHGTKGYWVCVCLSCGKEHIKHMTSLMYRKIHNCGCNLDHLIDLTGEKFGRLTVLRRGEHVKYKPRATFYKWVCRCECGKEVHVASTSLTSGLTKSCGCSRIKVRTEAELHMYTSGMVKRNRLYWYKSWVKDVKREAGHQCEVCGSTSKLQAHHVIEWAYLRFRPNIRQKVGMGRALCKDCHTDYHNLCGRQNNSHPQFLAYVILNLKHEGFKSLPKQERKELMEDLEKSIIDCFEHILKLEEDKKAINEEIKERIIAFANSHDLEPEALAEGIKKYKKYLKDPAKFVLVDYSIDKVLHSFVKEYQDKQITQEDVE